MTRWFSGDDIRSICRDVHFLIAREIVKNKRINTVARTEDYERFIKGRIPQTINWLHKVASAYFEGKIEEYELDKQLKEDIESLFVKDPLFPKVNEDHKAEYVV